jgi:hypothetical protein
MDYDYSKAKKIDKKYKEPKACKKKQKKESSFSSRSISCQTYMAFLDSYFEIPNRKSLFDPKNSNTHLIIKDYDVRNLTYEFDDKCNFLLDQLKDLNKKCTLKNFGFLMQEFKAFFRS